jgi:HD-like signal output (HDOD) protein
VTLIQEHVGSALIIIGDRLEPKPYLRNLVSLIGQENSALSEESQVRYIVCQDYSSLAVALKKFRSRVRLILIGPGLDGRPDMIGRLVGGKIHTIMVVDPRERPLAEDETAANKLAENLRQLGNVLVHPGEATTEFFEPIVKQRVVCGLSSQAEIQDISPQERALLLERRLESVTKFPSLPDTQQKVSALGEMSQPKNWAEAIDPDLPVKKVILTSLNSAHYGFRHRVKTIEQAVSLASTRTIRELVLACTVQRLFRKIPEARVEQFWKHSVATAYFARLFTLPALAENQSPQQRSEFERLALPEEPRKLLQECRLWKEFDVPEDLDPFTAGLLHDIGKVTMALCFEEALLMIDPIVEAGVKESDEKGEIWAESTRSVERALLEDMDHQVIGGRIAKRWGFEPALQQVILQHHDVGRQSPDILKVVAMADLAANTLHCYPFREDQHPLPRLLERVTRSVEQGFEDLDGALEAAAPELEKVLQGLEVPTHLWKTVDTKKFFALCHALRPSVRDATRSFLQMTTVVS